MGRYKVYKKSNGLYTIGDQDETDLFVVMRSIYLKNSKNINCKIKSHISKLNKIVVNTVIKDVISNIRQYVVYLKDILSLDDDKIKAIIGVYNDYSTEVNLG